MSSFFFNNTNNTNKFDLSTLVDLRLTRIEVVLLTTLFILTLLGNLIVIITLFFFPKRKRKHKKCFSYNKRLSRMSFYILNLSIADMNVAVMSILPQIIWRSSVIFNNSHILCKLVTFCQVFSVYASTFLLIVMAYDRYTCICWPIKSCSWTNRKALFGVLLSWLLAIVVSSPQLFLYKVQPRDAPNGEKVETCSIKWPSKFLEGMYLLFHALTQFLIPLCILIYFYANIFCAVSRNIRFKSDSLRIERGNTNSQNQHKETSLIENLNRINSYEPSVNNNDTNSNSSIYEPSGRKTMFSFLSTRSHRLSFCNTRAKIQRRFTANTKNNNNYSKNIFSQIQTNTSSVPMLTRSSSTSGVSENKLKIHKLSQSSAFTNSASMRISAKSPIGKNVPIMRQNLTRQELTKSKMKTLKLTLTVVIMYVLCSLPFYLCTFINYRIDISSHPQAYSNNFVKILIYVTTLTNMLYQLNSCANPFIYMVFNGYICKIVQKKWENCRFKQSNNIAGGQRSSNLYTTEFRGARTIDTSVDEALLRNKHHLSVVGNNSSARRSNYSLNKHERSPFL